MKYLEPTASSSPVCRSSSSARRQRPKFGNTIKQIAANEDQTCHGKNREAVSLRPFWRATFSVNDEPENLLTLPPLDESIADKIIIFKVQRPRLLDTPAWGKVRSVNMGNLVAEIPYFLDFLRRFEIPAELQEDRCGITYFQHPDIKVALKAMSQEERLLELIDESFWPEDATAGAGDFKGNASKVEQQLLHGSVRESASKLLYFSGSAGTYLARLAEREDGRVTYKTGRGGQREYIITHPTHPGTPGNRTTISPESLERVNQRNI